MSGTCRITLMGGFDVAVEGRPVRSGDWHHGSDALVKLLALERTHRCTRSQVTARLWPALNTRAAERHLVRGVRSACRALGTTRGVTLDGDLVQLWPTGALDVDLQRFEVLARRAASERGAREALEAYGGELLPDDRDAPWTEQRRTELRNSRLRLLATCGQLPGVIDLTHTQRVLRELQALRPR